MVIPVTSSAFGEGQPIPEQYSGEGRDISPPLSWAGLPDGTKELALICDDPDAPTPRPWVHWVIYKIPASLAALSQDIEKTRHPKTPPGALQGVNTWGKIGYGGPMPPPGHGVHHYHFRLYALDTAIQVQAGLNQDALVQAMQGHILAQGLLIGTYQR